MIGSPSPNIFIRRTNSRHTSWEFGDDRHGGARMVAVHASGHPFKTAKCNPCVKIGKNLKSIMPSSKWAPLKMCRVPYEEIQIDFGGPIYNETNQEFYFLACIDRFSKIPKAEVFDRANAENIMKFIQEYVLIHGSPRTISLDEAQCQILSAN